MVVSRNRPCIVALFGPRTSKLYHLHDKLACRHMVDVPSAKSMQELEPLRMGNTHYLSTPIDADDLSPIHLGDASFQLLIDLDNGQTGAPCNRITSILSTHVVVCDG